MFGIRGKDSFKFFFFSRFVAAELSKCCGSNVMNWKAHTPHKRNIKRGQASASNRRENERRNFTPDDRHEKEDMKDDFSIFSLMNRVERSIAVSFAFTTRQRHVWCFAFKILFCCAESKRARHLVTRLWNANKTQVKFLLNLSMLEVARNAKNIKSVREAFANVLTQKNHCLAAFPSLNNVLFLFTRKFSRENDKYFNYDASTTKLFIFVASNTSRLALIFLLFFPFDFKEINASWCSSCRSTFFWRVADQSVKCFFSKKSFLFARVAIVSWNERSGRSGTWSSWIFTSNLRL